MIILNFEKLWNIQYKYLYIQIINFKSRSELFDEIKSKLSIPLKQEELFLEVFEDEVGKLGKMATFGQLLGDTSVISEISQTPMSG